jgi:hypothetical protein
MSIVDGFLMIMVCGFLHQLAGEGGEGSQPVCFLGATTFSIMTLTRKGFYVTFCINDTQQK